jgi:hypothetical protein
LIAVGSADFSVRVITCSLANQNLETKADVFIVSYREEHLFKELMEMLRVLVKYFYQLAIFKVGLII